MAMHICFTQLTLFRRMVKVHVIVTAVVTPNGWWRCLHRRRWALNLLHVTYSAVQGNWTFLTGRRTGKICSLLVWCFHTLPFHKVCVWFPRQVCLQIQAFGFTLKPSRGAGNNRRKETAANCSVLSGRWCHRPHHHMSTPEAQHTVNSSSCLEVFRPLFRECSGCAGGKCFFTVRSRISTLISDVCCFVCCPWMNAFSLSPSLFQMSGPIQQEVS